LFFVFQSPILYIDFTSIAASSTLTDDEVTREIFNTNLQYFLLLLYSKLVNNLA